MQAKEQSDQDAIRRNENKIIELGEMLQKQGNAQELGQLVKNVRPYLGSLSKAKAARLVRTLVDLFLDMDSAIGLEVDLCKERDFYFITSWKEALFTCQSQELKHL